MKTLYAKDSKGNIKQWSIQVIETDPPIIRTTSGRFGMKMTDRDTIVKAGKNIGKANETTPLEQAHLEAEAKWRKKIDEDYAQSIEEAEATVSILPMLAHKYDDKKHLVTTTWLAQPKLDGVRCLVTRKTDGSISFMSRGGKEYTAMQKHSGLVNTLRKSMAPGDIWDGELYKHGWSLQRIVSAVKKERPDTLHLSFWHYDNVIENITFKTRYKETDTSESPFIQSVETKPCTNLKEAHDKYVQAGFEGLILRDPDGLYSCGNRSASLLKYKEFLEDEFKIVDTLSETNIIRDDTYTCIMFTCETEDGEQFNCRPRGTFADRQQMWQDKDSYVGKLLTVRYFALTEKDQGAGRGVPQFPVGICIRDY